MLYIRRLFKQDQTHQMTADRDGSKLFFQYDYTTTPADRAIDFCFKDNGGHPAEDGTHVIGVLHPDTSESRINGNFKTFVFSTLKANIDDFLLIWNDPKDNTKYVFTHIGATHSWYPVLSTLVGTKNHILSCEHLIEPSIADYICQYDNQSFTQNDLVAIFKTGLSSATTNKTTFANLYGILYAPHLSPFPNNGPKSIAYQALGTSMGAFGDEIGRGVTLGLFLRNLISIVPAPKKLCTCVGLPLQRIFYGAPGTGKSYATNEAVKKWADTIRTTFHPDSDYASFVGCYKPTEEEAEARVVPVVLSPTGTTFDRNNGTYKEKRITYNFVKQAFTKAYLLAWKKMTEAVSVSSVSSAASGAVGATGTAAPGLAVAPDNNVPTNNNDGSAKTGTSVAAPTAADSSASGIHYEVAPQFLVIEEINRGNCAQIFGDLFQLLDRNEKGFSEYPIEADADLQKAIKKAFEEEPEFLLLQDINVNSIMPDYKSAHGGSLSSDIQNGHILLLPNNLYIWATMNTSDQSLFPMDSAFKRRWEWEYIPIEQPELKKGETPNKSPLAWKIIADNHWCYWWEFLLAINKEIMATTQSEDKQLGYFFTKADKDGNIDAKMFVSKVMFFLWNDVFKDESSDIFRYEELKDDPWKMQDYKPEQDVFTFRSFVTGRDKFDEKLIHWFINNLFCKYKIGALQEADNYQPKKNPASESDFAYMRPTEKQGEDDDSSQDTKDMVDKADALGKEAFSKEEYYEVLKRVKDKLKKWNPDVKYTHTGKSINYLKVVFSSREALRPCYIFVALGNNKADVKLYITTEGKSPQNAVDIREALKAKAENCFKEMAGGGFTWEAIDDGKSDTESANRGWRLTNSNFTFDDKGAEWILYAIKKIDEDLKDEVAKALSK